MALAPPRSRTSRIEYRTVGTQQPGGAIYALLYAVQVRHLYYNGVADGRCPDLMVVPTPQSADLIADLGLVFKAQADGFALFYNVKRLDSLQQWLRDQTVPDGGGNDGGAGCWARLSFQFAARTADFVSISDLPIDTNPYRENFFLSNQTAHGATATDQLATLCPGDRVQASDFQPVSGSSLTVTVPKGADAVIVRDLSGASVLTQPVVGPQADVMVDLSSLPYDSYSLWAAIDGAEQPADPAQVAYNQQVPQPLGLVDILFSAPLPDSAGLYPLSVWDDAAPVGGLCYRLPFAARSTFWQYYIVNAAGEGRLENLAISGDGADFTLSSTPVPLPTGQAAWCFAAASPLALRRIPPQRFRLTGTRVRGDGSRQNIKVDVLPAAPATPVWPADADGACLSQIYVYA